MSVAEAGLPTFYEFFAGGGMVRAGLTPAWRCLFANDFDVKKCAAYRDNWGWLELKAGDVGALTLADLPAQTPDLVWASFPCQDLSLAGNGAGLEGNRSGTFWPFWTLVRSMIAAGKAPSIIALENVCGALTSHGGKDFRAIVQAFADLGYDVGAMVIDAELFVPQSRPRLFFVGVPKAMRGRRAACETTDSPWATSALRRAHDGLPEDLKESWVWWHVAPPALRNTTLAQIVDRKPQGVTWNSAEETRRLLAMMSDVHREKVDEARRAGREVFGTLYRRTRPDAEGRSVQRVEVRFDGVAGCLRTPAGGSSRQSLLVINGRSAKSRLLSARETARLMGLDDAYTLPPRYNEAYHLTGDGVVAPVVRHLSEQLLLPLLALREARAVAA